MQQVDKWPLVQELLRTNACAYIDYAIAESLLKPFTNASEDSALFLCYLSLASRLGHVCVQISSEGIYPPLHSLSRDEECAIEATWNCIPQAEQKICRGVKDLPGAIVGTETITNAPIICQQDRYYWQRNWNWESLFLSHFKRIVSASPIKCIDVPSAHSRVDQLLLGKKILPEQAQAILQACQHTMSIVTGGPGTGKTYTVGHMVSIFLESMPTEQRQSCRLLLAAPTGKAAMNLHMGLSKVLHHSHVEVQTLHAALGLKKGPAATPKLINADIVIIDESSMIDLRLMALLFSSLRTGARLILLGDRYQLPAVESGSVFADLITCCAYQQYGFAELKKCMRTESDSIIAFAHAVCEGDIERALDSSLHQLNTLGHSREIQKEIIDYAMKHYPVYTGTSNISVLMEAYQKFRLLTPLRRGAFGVESLNAICAECDRSRQKKEQKSIAPIVVLRNDYRQGLSNGEIGLLVRHHKNELGKGDYAIFPDRENGVKQIPALLLPKYEYAYCLSIHKSQGSEFDEVLLLLPKGTEIFGREVIYTGATRARRKLSLWMEDRASVVTAIERKTSRLSGIIKRLNVNS